MPLTKRAPTRKPRVRRRPYRRGRRIASARPMRALKTNYRAINEYRYMRETLPQTVSFTIIPAGNFPAMGYMSFENLQFNQLPNYNEFVNLYARYKVDKIVTTLVPMFQQVVSNNTQALTFSQQLELTRVNTKWLSGDFPISANSDAQLVELAQLQGKSKSLYASKRPLKIVTMNPGVEARGVVDAANNEIDSRKPMPWLSLGGPNQAIDIPLKHNALLFAARVGGDDVTSDWKFRVTHQIFFRCSQVG